ncbi:MAG TPA: arsenic resistance N-acetyltransferase ArsN2 [Gemmatimonadaceae bacterium]|nr:arsenic resistance N-acetyltransferase ArsN2 [Gemmatimonadaceae bacterium]
MQANQATTSYSLRPARSSDLDRVIELLAAARLPTEGLEEQFGDRYVIAESDGRIIGAEGMELYGPYGLLRSAVVEPAWRGQGIGEALTENRLSWARAQQLRAIYLLTMTAADFFPRFGFVVVERESAPAEVQRSREFCGQCPMSAITMRLTLI